MRGFPLINGLIVIFCLFMVGIPLISLTQETRGRAPTLPQRPVTQEWNAPTWVRLKFAHPPLEIALSHLGTELWRTRDSTEMIEGKELQLTIPPEGIDLILEAHWKEGTPETAIQLELEPEALSTRVAVAWGEGELVEALTFHWAGLSQ